MLPIVAHPCLYFGTRVVLDAGLALSMASAVVANVALIIRFLERRVRLATFVAIGGLVIHGKHARLEFG
jgi:hypothetical protein